MPKHISVSSRPIKIHKAWVYIPVMRFACWKGLIEEEAPLVRFPGGWWSLTADNELVVQHYISVHPEITFSCVSLNTRNSRKRFK